MSMTYLEAEELARSIAPDAGYLRVTLNHNTSLILPYEAGVQLMQALTHAEYLHNSYSSIPEIRAMGADDLPVDRISAEHRRQYHMAQLLRVPFCELSRIRAEEQPPPF